MVRENQAHTPSHDDRPEPDEEPPNVGSVPAGGRGADSGATPAVHVDDTDEDQVPNISSTNDIPGVGTRGRTERDAAHHGQYQPRQEQNEAQLEEELRGIVVQTRADIGAAPEERVRGVLQQRLRDAGIDVSDAELEEMTADVKVADNDGGRRVER